MKKLLGLMMVLVVLFIPAFAQESMNEKHPTDADKVAVFDTSGKIVRGDAIGNSKKVSLKNVLKNPEKYSGKTVRVSGYVVRSCKMEGCWAEIGDSKEAKATVRVKMKDHSFFIPLKSAGYRILTEGVFSLKTLSKKEVDHLIEEDGAKFENINKDGTVSEVSFLASGIELSK